MATKIKRSWALRFCGNIIWFMFSAGVSVFKAADKRSSFQFGARFTRRAPLCSLSVLQRYGSAVLHKLIILEQQTAGETWPSCSPRREVPSAGSQNAPWCSWLFSHSRFLLLCCRTKPSEHQNQDFLGMKLPVLEYSEGQAQFWFCASLQRSNGFLDNAQTISLGLTVWFGYFKCWKHKKIINKMSSF